ncbi:MotA/TolQ/ExbB proton channel family protein [Ketobacter sp. MCCC 1A13808]|uniref:MotA/TolQ/ExbB proton channel family protein n=1 Tax=Ketobacter sp. MCCC 1A13808 TaxID=2602738 RepID=UPI0012EBB790|nr:MotA/TolQ/ExbB proton channel family protein [Ketobacter sp. MCCC 1A13808]MVF12110.1 MotA/TolQ/ExbB proton channel family protein [Ketobacter sp. MCCC 1A13808]
MNPLELEEQKARVIRALMALLISIVFIAICSLLAPPAEEVTGEMRIPDVLFDRSNPIYPFTIQNIMWVMFFIGLGELLIRLSRANQEASQLHLNILPEEDDTMLRSKDLVPIYKTIYERKQSRFYFLQRLSKRVILQFQSSQSIDQANSLLNSSMELMQHEIDLKYNMLRYVVWLIPTLGFIGTVIGIALALSDASHMPDISSGGSEIKEWMGGLTTKLGIAFNTTLVALLMSAILVFFLHLTQGREEMALNAAGQYCIDNLINRLFEEK